MRDEDFLKAALLEQVEIEAEEGSAALEVAEQRSIEETSKRERAEAIRQWNEEVSSEIMKAVARRVMRIDLGERFGVDPESGKLKAEDSLAERDLRIDRITEEIWVEYPAFSMRRGRRGGKARVPGSPGCTILDVNYPSDEALERVSDSLRENGLLRDRPQEGSAVRAKGRGPKEEEVGVKVCYRDSPRMSEEETKKRKPFVRRLFSLTNVALTSQSIIAFLMFLSLSSQPSVVDGGIFFLAVCLSFSFFIYLLDITFSDHEDQSITYGIFTMLLEAHDKMKTYERARAIISVPLSISGIRDFQRSIRDELALEREVNHPKRSHRESDDSAPETDEEALTKAIEAAALESSASVDHNVRQEVESF